MTRRPTALTVTIPVREAGDPDIKIGVRHLGWFSYEVYVTVGGRRSWAFTSSRRTARAWIETLFAVADERGWGITSITRK